MSLILASVTAYIITLMNKWGIRNTLQSNAPNDFVWKLLDCDFCLSWWMGLVIGIVLAIALKDGWLLVCPIVSAKISQRLLF